MPQYYPAGKVSNTEHAEINRSITDWPSHYKPKKSRRDEVTRIFVRKGKPAHVPFAAPLICTGRR